MAGQALYRKWRSQTFEDIIGQEHVSLTLRNALAEGRMSHAYLFTGPRGTGKTSTARILAKALNCLAEDPAARPCNQCRICTAITEGRQLDLIEIDAASNRGIDEIRDLRDKIGFRPNEARYRVYIIDEVHMLTKEAFNALLKTLEEPPPHAVLILATTEPDRVPETVRSRCQRFDFRRIAVSEITAHLEEILRGEGRAADPEALAAIARRATGSMRDAISLLDQLLSFGDDVLRLERVERVLGMVSAQVVSQLVDCLVAGRTGEGLDLINHLVSDGVELGQLVDQIVAHLRGVLFVRLARSPELLDLPQDVAALMARQAELLSPPALLAAVREFTDARAALRDQVPGVPQLPVEVAFLRSALLGAASPPSAGSDRPPAPRVPPSPPAADRPAGAPGAAPTSSAPANVGPLAPAPGPEPLNTAAEGDLLSLVQAGWDRFLVLTGKRCGMKVQAALRAVRELDVQGQTIVMQFSHAFSRDLVNEGENRGQVEHVWQEILGHPAQVRCLVMGEAVALPARAAAPAAGSGLVEDDVLLADARRLGAVVRPLAAGGQPGKTQGAETREGGDTR